MRLALFLTLSICISLMPLLEAVPKYTDSSESREYQGRRIQDRNSFRKIPHNPRQLIGHSAYHQGGYPNVHNSFQSRLQRPRHRSFSSYPISTGHHRFSSGFNSFGYPSHPPSSPPYSVFAASPQHVVKEAQLSSYPSSRTPHTPSAPFTTYPSSAPHHNGFSAPIIAPAHLTHHKQIHSPPSNHVSRRPSNPFSAFVSQSHHSNGYTPARTYTQAQPFLVSPHAEIESYNQPEAPHRSGGCSHSYSCVPIVTCAPYYETVRREHLGCIFYENAYGACCPKPSNRIKRRSLFGPLSISVPIRDFTVDELNQAAKEALTNIAKRDDIETDLQQRNIVVTNKKRPAYGHLQFFKTSPRATGLSRNGLIHEFTCDSLIKRFKLTPIEASFGLQKLDAKNTIIANTCPPNPVCGKKEEYYRTIDGSCNNLKNPKYGEARTTFQRVIPPQYSDGHSAPRRSVTGRELPSARVVSLTNVADADRPNHDFSLFVMQWGQFIDHDLTHTPIFRFGNESGIECCNEKGQFVEAASSHPACFPIEIPADDPFHAKSGRRCMNFIRSRPAARDGCNFGFVEQMNQVTHFLDGSSVYGSSIEEEEGLRSFQGGLLKVQVQMNNTMKSLLPVDPSVSEEDCNLVGTAHHCFMAGDNRVNEQPDLSIIHTLWVRQHNRLALEMARLNPHWTDETIYHETRRIVAAQMQHIVYNEWLPIILGTEDVEENDLLPLTDGFFGGYDHLLDATILNEFATVAFRFGHTLVEGNRRLYDKQHRNSGTLNLFEHFNSPRILYQKPKFDELIRGLFKQPMQSFDNFVADDLTNRLFQTDQMPFGMDLIALNIQRARDHGIPSYNDLREVCGIPRATSFNDLRDFLNPETVNIFRALYESVDDIDPFVAGISEVPVNGGVIGATFNCIIKDQFSRLKLGDRFFYENGGMKSSFTEAQLYEIRQTSWSRIVCENSDHIKQIQPLSLRLPGENNKKVPCSSKSIPTLDLMPWISAPF